MIAFLRKLWGFVRPYRGRFFIGLLCGIGYGLANGMLVASVNQVFKLVFEGKTSLHDQLAKAPAWLRPLAEWLRAHLPELSAPAYGDKMGWALVIGVIPAVMILRNALQYSSIYFVNWSAVNAIADP